MAFYGSSFSEGDAGEYYSNPYGSNYHIVPFQDSAYSYPGYEYPQPKLVQYSQPDYDQSENYYSSYGFLETKLIEYNPTPYHTGYAYPSTQFRISYSTTGLNEPETLEFTEPEFEDYDPTPYDGGYNIAQTYGKPLSPSDETCYPRKGLNKKNESNGDGSKPAVAIEEEKHLPSGGLKNASEDGDGGKDGKPLDLNQGKKTEGYVSSSDDDHLWSVNDNGYGYGYGYDKQVAQTQHGYGLDALDLCESMFGYWPCLFKDQKSYGSGQGVPNGGCIDNQWEGAADYFFGSGYSYSYAGLDNEEVMGRHHQ